MIEQNPAPPPPPAGLAESGTALWTAVLSGWELGTHELLILKEACRTADRLDRLAEAAMDAELTDSNFKGDTVANPLLVEARQQQIVLARLIAALRLPEEEGGIRPQRRGGARGVYSAPPKGFWSTGSSA